MLSDFRLNIRAACFFALAATGAWAQLPEGAGSAETEKLCTQCHELARSISLRQDRAGWEATVSKMVNLGAKAGDAEIQAVVDYLAAHYPAEEMPKIQVNQARTIEFESGLTLRRSQAAAIIEYRKLHGPFHSIEELKKVPGIDAARIEAKKDRLSFEEKR
jgi:competence protein ComEA